MTAIEPGDSTAPEHPSVAAIAQTVGRVLAEATASSRPKSPEDAEEISAITDAMVRLLIGVPMRSDGQLTIKALAAEAGLKRNKLTHKHTNLKDLFYALVRAQDERPRIADGIQRTIDDLTTRLARVRAERDELKSSVRQLARVVHVLEIENLQLREAAAGRSNVHSLHPLSRPPAG